MADGFARALLSATTRVNSAGIYPGTVNRLTIDVMREIGIDISSHRSKQLAEVAGLSFDLAVVLAESAFESVTQKIQAREVRLWAFPDPICEPGEDEVLKEKIRRVRDGIREKIVELRKLESLKDF